MRLALSIGLTATLALGALGCTGSFVGEPGGGGGDDGDDDIGPGNPDAAAPALPDAGPPPSFTLGIEPAAAELVLGETRTFTVTVTPEHGFTGAVDLAVAGALPSWLASFDAPTVNVTGATPVTATLTLQIPTSAEAGDAMLAVSGAAGALERSSPASDVTVKPELVIRIPQGSVENPENSFGPGGQLTVRFVAPGTKVTWVNDDSVNHRIHADGINGFDHQPNEMNAQGGSYTVTIQAPGTYDYNCHIHGQMRGTLVVQ
jgi:plastocyanin